jgi:hypothetical protein
MILGKLQKFSTIAALPVCIYSSAKVNHKLSHQKTVDTVPRYVW